jgi:hypothetical protein
MAEEAAVVEEGAEQKPKSKLIPIILGAVGLISSATVGAEQQDP